MTVLTRERATATRVRTLFVGNVAALVSLAIATVMVARAGGPPLVGVFTLMRVLPGLVGVLAAAGLPGAAPYFLASRRDHTRLRPTLVTLALAGGCVATIGWLALTPVLHRVFFPEWGTGMVLVGAWAVFTQLPVAVGKALLQGESDMVGANRAIITEEAAFLPLYAVALIVGRGPMPMMYALIAADIAVAAGIAMRLRRGGFFAGWGRPDVALGKEICSYGMRGSSAACFPWSTSVSTSRSWAPLPGRPCWVSTRSRASTRSCFACPGSR
jgi:O-antigen/teichoic acid export membrane protein